MKTRNKGLILSFVGVLILSPDSLFIRLVNLDDFCLIFYRSFLLLITWGQGSRCKADKDFIKAPKRYSEVSKHCLGEHL